ncbi:MAG: starvation-inducible DNA-binding protein [Saprospiraceae bacterium]|jgi:starvation-inducible DNA-binding protein
MEVLEQNNVQDKVDIHIGLNLKNRKTIVKRLSKLLADEQVLFTKLRNYHWNVKGMFFQTLHLFFEEQYTVLFTVTDDIAERIRSLGEYSIGSLSAFLDNTRVKETNHLDGNAKEMLQNILVDHEFIIQKLRSDIKITQALKDEGTADFLIGLMQQHEKMAWMVRSHLGQ